MNQSLFLSWEKGLSIRILNGERFSSSEALALLGATEESRSWLDDRFCFLVAAVDGYAMALDGDVNRCGCAAVLAGSSTFILAKCRRTGGGISSGSL